MLAILQWPLLDSFADVPADAGIYKWIPVSFIDIPCR